MPIHIHIPILSQGPWVGCSWWKFWRFESQLQDHFDLMEELELGVCEQIDLLLLQNGDGDGGDGDGNGNGNEEEDEEENKDVDENNDQNINKNATLNYAVLACFQTDDEVYRNNKERVDIDIDIIF